MASQKITANWPRLAEAGGRPGLGPALAGRAGGGRTRRSLGAAVSTYARAAALECDQRAEAAGQDGV
eukprot:scaffold12292_cov36-Phaeocystis_antarctica.AAC.2